MRFAKHWLRANERGYGNERGFGLIEALGVMALLGAVSYGIVTVFSSSSKQIMKAEVSSGFEALNNAAMNNAREALSNVGSSQTAGICRVMATDMKSGGVGYVKALLPPRSTNVFDADISARFNSSQWQAASNCPSDGAYRKCYTPTDQNQALNNKSLLSRKPRVSVALTPIMLRREDGSTGQAKLIPVELKTSGNVELNARDLAFLVSSEITYESDKDAGGGVVDKKTLVHSMVWAGEFSCRISVTDESGTKQLMVNPSGIGSGVDTNTLFSTQKEKGDDLMTILFSTVSYTEAIVNARERAETLMEPQYTFSSACVERSYRCPDSGGGREWSPNIRIEGLAQYNRNNEIIQTNTLIARVGVEFAEKNGSGAIQSACNVSGPQVFGTTPNTFNFPPISTAFTLVTQNSDQSVCPNVCSASNKYNNNSFTDNNYRARIKLKLVQKGDQEVEIADNRATGCICCWGKMCGGVGTKIASFCHAQPPEPIDARVPECAAAKTANLEEFNIQPQLNPSGPGCVAMEIGSDNKAKFSIEACGSSHPYVCFALGAYKLAHKQGANDLAEGNFQSGRKACYDMGLVDVDAAKVDERIAQQNNGNGVARPNRIGTRYRYVDNAYTGIFLAPTTEGEVARVAELLRQADIKGKVWIGLRAQERQVFGEPPLIDFTTSENISFFDATNLLWFAKDQSHSFDSSSPSAAILVHGRRYYGLLHVKEQQSDSLPAICYRVDTGAYFLTENRVSKQADAFALCRDAGGLFLPPVMPLQWVNALMKVSRIPNALPWPEQSGGSKPNAAWVAMSNPNSDGSWAAPATGVTFHQMHANFTDAEAGNVKHAICKTGGGGFELVDSDNCSNYFDPDTMSANQRVALVRAIKERGWQNKKFKIKAGAPPANEGGVSTDSGTSTSTATSTDTSTATSTDTATSTSTDSMPPGQVR